VVPETIGAVGGAPASVVNPVPVVLSLLIEFPERSFTPVVTLILNVVSIDKLSDGSTVNDSLSLVYGEDEVICTQLLKLSDEI
jgi:hypothetical protein